MPFSRECPILFTMMYHKAYEGPASGILPYTDSEEIQYKIKIKSKAVRSWNNSSYCWRPREDTQLKCKDNINLTNPQKLPSDHELLRRKAEREKKDSCTSSPCSQTQLYKTEQRRRDAMQCSPHTTGNTRIEEGGFPGYKEQLPLAL